MNNDTAHLETKHTHATGRAFQVAWAYRDGRARGNGQPLDLETATTWANYGNRTYPEIKHRVVPVN